MMGWALAAQAAPELSSGLVLSDTATDDGADIVLVYAGEQRGRIGPCGCEATPRGGLGGLATRVETLRAGPVPVLLLNPGAWASSTTDAGVLTAAAIRDNGWFHRAWYEVRFDAANVGFRDLPSIVAHPGLVSATHRTEGGPIARYKTFSQGGLQIAVTGVSRDGLEYLRPEGAVVSAPLDGLAAILPELQRHDLVVVLAYDLPGEVQRIAALPGVDVVIDAAGYTERWPPLAVGDAVWVRSRDEGAELGELRLWLTDGRITRADHARLPIGPELPVPPRIERFEQRQRAGEPLPSGFVVTAPPRAR